MAMLYVAISCVTCGETFDNKAQRKKHRDNKHPKGTSFTHANKEYQLIAGDEPGKFKCPKCDRQLSGMNGLRRHIVKCSQTYQTDPVTNDDGSSGGDDLRQDNFIPENACRYIIDPARMIEHVTRLHKLDIPDIEQARGTIQGGKLRPHLAVISQGSHANDDYLTSDDYLPSDDSDSHHDSDRVPVHEFSKPGFVPGSSPVRHLPVYEGFKCLVCIDTCTIRQRSMRSHIARHHPGDQARYVHVSVQAFYDHGILGPQLKYVEVGHDEEPTPYEEPLGIPDNLDLVGTADRLPVEKRDRNLFGENFGAYHLIETLMIDFEELSPCFWTTAGTLLRAVRVAEHLLNHANANNTTRQFFHSVRQRHTVHNYNTVTSDVGEDQSRRIGLILAELGMAILHQQSDSVILVNEDGVSEASLLIVPWAINLLSLRPNGTFLNYGQITHNVAAISYCLRSIYLRSIVNGTDPRAKAGYIFGYLGHAGNQSSEAGGLMVVAASGTLAGREGD
ncbi:hypothetical protein V1506DRAFT_569446 [Lipomyces tetrasporus]